MSHGRTFRLAVLLAFAVATVTFTAPAPHQLVAAEGTDNQLPDDRSAPRSSERWYDDANEIPEAGSPGEFASKMRARFGQRFSAVWIDRGVSPSRLVVGAVNPSQSDRDGVRKDTRNNGRINVVDVKYSEDDLNGYRARMQPTVERSGGDWMVGVDPTVNKVVIHQSPLDPSLRAQFDAMRIPRDAYVLDDRDGGGQAAHATRQTYPPYEGGLDVEVRLPGESGGNCTTWFTGTAGSNAAPRGATAGHCNGHIDDHAYIGNDDLGRPGGNTYAEGTDSDAVRIAIAASALTNRIKTETSHRTVKKPGYLVDDLAVGLNVCFQGISTGGRCGPINFRDFSSTMDGVVHDHLWQIDADSTFGNSGGPVYGVRSNDGTARVAGMVTGHAHSSWDMRFHALSYIKRDLNFDIYYG